MPSSTLPEQQKPISILAELPPVILPPMGVEMLRNDVRANHSTGSLHFKNGEHFTSFVMRAALEQYWPYVNKMLEDRGMTFKDDPILSQLAKLDNDPALSKEELVAGLLAAESLPNVRRYGLVDSGVGLGFGKANKDGSLDIGMQANITEDNLKLAVVHMREYLATAKQFLGDNYKADMNEDTRSAESDKAYTKLMHKSAKDIQKNFDRIR